MTKTVAVHGAPLTPGLVNALIHGKCVKDPMDDGEFESPTFDQLKDSNWLTRAILQELYSSLGLNPGDHLEDPLNGAILRAFIRTFGNSPSERSNTVSKWTSMINTLNGDPADFCMDMSFDVLQHGQKLDDLEADVSAMKPDIASLQQRVSEVRSASILQTGSKVALALSVTNNIVSLQLPPGSWLIEGDVTIECHNASAPSWVTGPSRVTIDSGDNSSSWTNYDNVSYFPDMYVEGADIKWCTTHVTSKLFTISANTWFRLRVRIENSVSGASAFGRIVAVRVPAL